MLSGDNGLLTKAGDAKTQTGIGQEKETIALAYNSALAKKVGNGDLTAVTAGELNTELANQGAVANGSNPIKVTFADSKRQYTINSSGTIDYAGIKNDEDSNIQLSITATQTESRAVILKVTATSTEEESGLTELQLQELEETDPEQVHSMFVEAVTQTMNPPFELTWNWFEQTFGTENTMNTAFNSMNIAARGYNNVYDFIINAASSSTQKQYVFSCTGNENLTGTEAEFIVTNPEPVVITATEIDGNKSANLTWNEYPNTKKEIYSEIQNSNYTLTQDGYTAIIPAGFAYGTSSNVGTISNGLVITDSVDENGYSNGNEFVWIPINTDSLEVVNTDKKMAQKNGSTESYKGILYGQQKAPTGQKYGWGALNTAQNYKEPLYLTDTTYGDATSYNAGIINTNTLQDEYDDMILGVKQYGGFYVGRYEMSIENGKGISKLGVLPSSGANAETKMWYGLYTKAKSYNKTGITSEMIWGSQYDAILNFYQNTSLESTRITEKTNGNHNKKLLKTGTWLGSDGQTDILNNIFDLEGNLFEWTKEADDTNNGRVVRGGNYGNSSYAIFTRGSQYPKVENTYASTRITFYINP